MIETPNANPVSIPLPKPPTDAGAALAPMLKALGMAVSGFRPSCVGHRIVHGGPDLDGASTLDDGLIETLKTLSPLAPLHQPHNLRGVAAARKAFPEAKQVAAFDTAFHRHHPWVNDTFALPQRFYDQGVRRYGFHGLSYQSIIDQLREDYPDLAKGRVIVGHLGSGASLCAIHDGRSIGSTMGFSALDGLPMGTRCGQLDPGAVLHLIGQLGMSVKDVETLLYKECGLKGLSGISNDMREQERSTDPAAARAIDYFIFRLKREIGAMAAVLEGVDALVLTGGIGENATSIRARTIDGLGYLGLKLDQSRNQSGGPVISQDGTPPVLVLPSQEEKVIAPACIALSA